MTNFLYLVIFIICLRISLEKNRIRNIICNQVFDTSEKYVSKLLNQYIAKKTTSKLSCITRWLIFIFDFYIF